MKNDKGYIFAGPHVEEKVKKIKEGVILVDNHRTGTIFSENPESPWHYATFYSHGSITRDSEGNFIQEVALCETTDADGDITWSVLWRPANEPGKLHFVVGTGKWENIAGNGETLGIETNRADGYTMPKYEIQWGIDKESNGKIASLVKEGEYTNHATSLSFHGPHVTESTRELSNGLSLVVSTQSGVLMGEDPEVISPRSYATCFDRGTTVKQDDKTLGDVMLLEDTDPDGDIVWLIHVWWYGKGPGSYQFIGGTGKWEGITGEGTTLGMLRQRSDDHYMLRSEIHWRIEQ